MMQIGSSSAPWGTEKYSQVSFKWRWRALVVAMVGLPYLGCNAGLNLAPVEGEVQFEGSPMTGGTVLLIPVAGGKSAIGEILEDGRFQLTTLQPYDGAVPGNRRNSRRCGRITTFQPTSDLFNCPTTKREDPSVPQILPFSHFLLMSLVKL